MTDFAKLLQPDRGQPAQTIELIDDADTWLAAQPPRTRALAGLQRFTGKPGTHLLIQDDADAWHVAAALEGNGPWCLAKLADAMPAGTYRLTGSDDLVRTAEAGTLGWLLAQHRFTRYRAQDCPVRVLLTSNTASIEQVVALAEATAMVRDMVDTPASDCGPAELEAAAQTLAVRQGATIEVTRGDQLAQAYPMIHIVGFAATRERAPRLVEISWGDPDHPRVAIIGKGVTFDTGGLDIKPSSGMRLMKKDMGGAAHALALADLVMRARLPVRLHLLIPAVENSIGSHAFRPGDVLRTRAGLTVENTNTDAEGRLILADALTRAGEESPELILDFATLTGAARVALGPDLPAMFTDDESLATDFLAAATAVQDPLWRLPLWDGYDDMLKSDIADLVNAPDGGLAGAITAALFLRRFAPTGVPWAHIDTFAWRSSARPGRPKGGEALGLRAAYELLTNRYAR